MMGTKCGSEEECGPFLFDCVLPPAPLELDLLQALVGEDAKAVFAKPLADGVAWAALDGGEDSFVYREHLGWIDAFIADFFNPRMLSGSDKPLRSASQKPTFQNSNDAPLLAGLLAIDPYVCIGNDFFAPRLSSSTGLQCSIDHPTSHTLDS